MANTKMQKKDVCSGADVFPEEAPVVPTSQNIDVPVPKKSGGGQASGSGESGKRKRVTVVVPSPKKEGENAEKPKTWLLSGSEGQESDVAGTPEDQQKFLREVKTFYMENSLEFRAPVFYRKPLNMLKLWREVTKLGGYDVVTSCKLWRQVGESFNPPKTCTTVSYTFRIFYEKALLEYENHLKKNGEIDLPRSLPPLVLTPKGPPVKKSPKVKQEGVGHQVASGRVRVRRESALRAMEGWHTLDLDGPDEEEEEEALTSTRKQKKIKSIGPEKNITQTDVVLPVASEGRQVVAEVIDMGPPADWVKINVYETRDSFEVYVMVPGLLREEVRVQSDPAGRLVITGKPDEIDNPWGITPFEKLVCLSARIDAVHTSSVLTLHGRLFIRAPYAK